MNGGEIFNFTIEVAPKSVQSLLDKAHCKLEDIDLFVFHQANEYILEHLRRRIGIAAERFQVTISHCGNTCSSTIPIALKHAEIEGRLRENMLVMLVGFGPGLSWGSTLLRWSGPAACSQQSGSGN